MFTAMVLFPGHLGRVAMEVVSAYPVVLPHLGPPEPGEKTLGLAKRLLRAEMVKRGVSYEELAEELEAIGVHDTPVGGERDAMERRHGLGAPPPGQPRVGWVLAAEPRGMIHAKDVPALINKRMMLAAEIAIAERKLASLAVTKELAREIAAALARRKDGLILREGERWRIA